MKTIKRACFAALISLLARLQFMAPVFTRGSGKKLLLFDLPYPYLRRKIYQNTSLWTVAGAFWANGFDVEVFDPNIDGWWSFRLLRLVWAADLVGVSPTGSPNALDTLKLCRQIKHLRPGLQVLVSGQWAEGFDPWEFEVLFAGTNAVQYVTSEDFRKVGLEPQCVDNLFHHPMWPVMERHQRYTGAYLKAKERALVVSRGCIYNCDFCAALNYSDLLFMVRRAKQLGLVVLEFYSTALDFCQNPEQLQGVLECVAYIVETENFQIRLRGLSCMNSYLRADRLIPNFAELLRRAGVWCLGFGIDGPNEKVWEDLHKTQNHASDVGKVAELTRRHGLTFEILMFAGDPGAPVEVLHEIEQFTKALLDTYAHAVSRIHIAKVWPGSAWWRRTPVDVKLEFLCQPSLFYNLDALACASTITHPEPTFRREVNKMYLRFLWEERRRGRCVSSTIFPQGGTGVASFVAKLANRFMPFDR
jgi:hypothetical protein